MPSGATSVCRRSSDEWQITDSTGETRTPLLSESASVFGILGVVAFAATLVSAGVCLEMIQDWSYLKRMLTIQKTTFTYRSIGHYNGQYNSNAAPDESLADSMCVVRH
jgi:hypothetical protein